MHIVELFFQNVMGELAYVVRVVLDLEETERISKLPYSNF